MQKSKKPQSEKIKLPPKFYLEIIGEGCLRCYLCGALGIRELSDERIGIILKNGAVNVEGKRLKLSIYDNNSLEIEGNIDNISVKYKSKNTELKI